MARYIDAELLNPEDFENCTPYQAQGIINEIPTADVVPKSEVEALVSAVDNDTKEFLKLHDAYQEQRTEIERLETILNSYALQYGTVVDQQKVIDKAKTEVAREIFEEVDVLVEDWKHNRIQSIQFIAELAELKKKYTEGDNEES